MNNNKNINNNIYGIDVNDLKECMCYTAAKVVI